MSVATTHPSAALLRSLLAGTTADVHLPGEPGYAVAAMPWNVAVTQRPAAVVEPRTTADVAETVVAARRAGLRVAPQSTGHNAGPLARQGLDDVVLLRTGHLDHVEIDPERRVARVGGGALWAPVVEAAAAHGLAVLHGSSPDVAVAGYTLGGGMFLYARKHGLAASHLVSAEVVLADGSVVRASADEHPELFWALRGGGGNFGVVTELEIGLLDLPDVYAGMLLFDATVPGLADRVVRTWAAWAADAPDEVTTSLRLLNLPPLPELPPFLRGRSLVAIDGAVLGTDGGPGTDEDAERILAPLRALGAEMDTFARVPAASVVRLHMDPEGPTPGLGRSAVLGELPDDAIDAFLASVGPGSALLAAELRQLGGALSRPHPAGGAVSSVEGAFLLFGVGIPASPEIAAAVEASAVGLVRAMEPWTTGGHYLNFAEQVVETRTGHRAEAWEQLKGLRSAFDPDDVLVANHRVPRLFEDGRVTD
ncbi:FAD-binding oxidoreductase [Luteimicrobium subarcticum]|uniref:FAD/FMN-containing dehydrogenase n=1 Tax=Luteimicrobium subarcticum TaxID=620910 RepID=A0A2M8W1V7_9MICO|nr:FAD-binding oxidoreductase [Luteimicrobium subarcticum]PJI84904.1 FAD/FMN-containing dehydrogenase [Luteimicrobium subarcticum]